MIQDTAARQLTQARMEGHIDLLFDIAFERGCECEQLRTIANETGNRDDKLAYIAAYHALRQAVDEHREAVTMYRYWVNSYSNRT